MNAALYISMGIGWGIAIGLCAATAFWYHMWNHGNPE